MPTHTLTIELSEGAYARLQQHLDSGEYSSPTAFVEDALHAAYLPEDTFPSPNSGSTGQWLESEAMAALDHLAANPTDVYTPAQVRAYLAEERRRPPASK